MAQCPHCGESVAKEQETCFACGQKVRTRAYRAGQQASPAILILAGGLVLAGIVGVILVSAGRTRRARIAAAEQERAYVRDSVRGAARARRDTAKLAARSAAATALTGEIDKLEHRFNLVRRQVIKDQPSPAQTKLVAQISAEIARLRQLGVGVGDQTGSKSDSVRDEIRDGARTVRALISDLSRVPKK